MKLYTEEQVMDIILDSFISEYPTNANDILSNYSPIELPSDEEIGKDIGSGMHDYYKAGFIEGAKWMKDKILNQTK